MKSNRQDRIFAPSHAKQVLPGRGGRRGGPTQWPGRGDVVPGVRLLVRHNQSPLKED